MLFIEATDHLFSSNKPGLSSTHYVEDILKIHVRLFDKYVKQPELYS
jgi:hypothetical protein